MWSGFLVLETELRKTVFRICSVQKCQLLFVETEELISWVFSWIVLARSRFLKTWNLGNPGRRRRRTLMFEIEIGRRCCCCWSWSRYHHQPLWGSGLSLSSSLTSLPSFCLHKTTLQFFVYGFCIFYSIICLCVGLLNVWFWRELKFSWVFCFVWIWPCGSISIGKAGSVNNEVWCLGWFSFVKEWLEILCFSKVCLTEMQSINCSMKCLCKLCILMHEFFYWDFDQLYTDVEFWCHSDKLV